MVDIKDTTSNLVNDLGRLPLISECFDGDFARNEGNEVGDRVRFQEAKDGQSRTYSATQCKSRVEVLIGRWECVISGSEIYGGSC